MNTIARLIVVVALSFFSFGVVAADPVLLVSATTHHAKKKVAKKNAKASKPKSKKVKRYRKTPLKKVKPIISKNFKPKRDASTKTKRAIAAYKACMYDTPPGEEKVAHALLVNLAYRDKPLHGSPEQLGYEVCLADIMGLDRFQTQEDIDEAKGKDLFEVASPYIIFPDDAGNTLPPERRYARVWVKAYVEGLAQDLRLYLVGKYPDTAEESLERLRVNSLVRSLAAQRDQTSPAKCKNEICSTHLTGSTVDISNNGVYVSAEVRNWTRARLIEDRKNGKIVMIQEVGRPHYHIFVIPPTSSTDDAETIKIE